MQKIKINKDLVFDYDDLLCDVDLDCEFTLRDVLRVTVNSDIPMDILQKILRCKGLDDYYNEAESKPYKDCGDIEYLRLRLTSDSENDSGKIEGSKEWTFDGVGKEGVISGDVLELILKKNRATYREHYSVELSPMWKLADLKIKVDNKIYISGPEWKANEYVAHPSITLIELLHGIFWELSWFGSIDDRDKTTKELRRRVRKIKKGEVGNVVSIDRLKKKFKEK